MHHYTNLKWWGRKTKTRFFIMNLLTQGLQQCAIYLWQCSKTQGQQPRHIWVKLSLEECGEHQTGNFKSPLESCHWMCGVEGMSISSVLGHQECNWMANRRITLGSLWLSHFPNSHKFLGNVAMLTCVPHEYISYYKEYTGFDPPPLFLPNNTKR